jgi:hypothetical protein
LSSALIIAWLSIGAFMACFALTHTLLIAHVSLAVLAGVLCGLTANWWARSKLKATGLPTEAPPNGGRAARPNQESSRRVLQIGVPRGFLTVPLFLLGLIVGLIIVESVDSACTLTGIRGQKTGTSTGYVVQVHYDHEARADLVSMLVLAVLTVLACLTAKWNRIPISTFVGAAPVFALWMFGIGRSHFLDWGLWCVLAVCLLLSIACFAWLSSQRRRG